MLIDKQRGYFGIGVYHPKTIHNIGTLWRSAHCFGASFIFTVGHRYKHQPGDTTKAWKHVPLLEFQCFEHLLWGLPRDCQLVGIECSVEGSKPLPEAIHSERSAYLLGAEDDGLPEAVLKQCHRILHIPSTFCLNVAVAGSVVMYDRIAKGLR